MAVLINLNLDCFTKCISCENRESCKECESGYYVSKDGKRCIESCPDGETVLNKRCAVCLVSNCRDCNNDLNKCNDCVGAMRLLNNQCREYCPTGYYADGRICNRIN